MLNPSARHWFATISIFVLAPLVGCGSGTATDRIGNVGITDADGSEDSDSTAVGGSGTQGNQSDSQSDPEAEFGADQPSGSEDPPDAQSEQSLEPADDALPDFALLDANEDSARYQQAVSPRNYLGQISAWYFGHAT